MTRLCCAGKQAALLDDLPRLSCPDLAAAIVRWQQVWEDRAEAGACLGTMLLAIALTAFPSCSSTSQWQLSQKAQGICCWKLRAWPDKSHA